MTLLNKISSENNLKEAWFVVRNNSNSCGIDKISPENFSEKLDQNIYEISDSIKNNKYKVLPVIKIKPSFLNHKDRPLIIPTIKDRIVMRSISNSLVPVFEKVFFDCNFAYRPHKSALDAVEKAESYIQKNRFFFRTDIEKFFESINHETLSNELSKYIEDEKALKLIEKFIKSKIFDESDLIEPVVGLHQGLPISPILSNIYLTSLDNLMTSQGIDFIRYCDDILILTKTEEEILDCQLLLQYQLKKLNLKLKPEKTFKGEIRQGFTFLGYHFNQDGKLASKKSVEALDFKLKNIFEKEKNMDNLGKINSVVKGWENYFGNVENVDLNNLESFLGILKIRDFSNVENIIEKRNKIQNFATSSTFLDLAYEWRDLKQEINSLVEITHFFKYFKLQTNLELKKAGEFLKIDMKDLFEIIKTFKKHNDNSFIPEIFAEKKYYSLAQKFHEAIEQNSSQKMITYGIEKADDDFFKKYLNLFSGMTKTFSVETKDKFGNRLFTKIKKDLTNEVINSSIEGEITSALHIFKNSSEVKLFVIDIDISRECLSDDENKERNLKSAFLQALEISKQGKALGLNNYIEFSGFRGYHVWFFLENNISAENVRKVAFYVSKLADKNFKGLNIEIFPKKDILKESEESCLIKLPLGFHTISKNRGLFLDEKGVYYPNQIDFIKNIETINNSTFLQVLKIIEIEKNFTEEKTVLKKEKDIFENFPKTKKILQGCSVIRHLVKKAEDTGYLSHSERLLILSVLGNVKDEGNFVVHEVMKKCFNYNKGKTQKYFDKKYETPISCSKIKESYKDITALTDCSCFFSRIPKRGYASPNLYTEPDQRNKNISGYSSKEDNLIEVKNISPVISPLETKIIPSEIIEIKKEEVKKEVVVKEEIRKENEINDIDKKNEKKIIRAEIAENITKLINLKKQIRGIEKSLEKCESDLNKSFNVLNVNELEIEFGLLIRDKSKSKIEWRIEI